MEAPTADPRKVLCASGKRVCASRKSRNVVLSLRKMIF
ncbi:hypothetical protein DFJ69_3157 [Thermomonospora umbrina]|uniref:Uncharacterized protein n=1 Tax=Thermomonospora umbrina TaxID=111806 RepID=A0A3D9SUI2_9ACTN|nr:hypothetical protein DFJ69_3157 [Thermomonospora umbrina]